MINNTMQRIARPAARMLKAAPALSSRGGVRMMAINNGSSMPLDTLIKADHDKVRDLFKKYETTSTAEDKQTIAYTIIRELSMHSAKEEEVVYPVIGKVYGKDEQQHFLDEHMTLKKQLDQLQKADAKDTTAFDSLMSSIRQEFEQHIKEEENEEIPNLLKNTDVDANDLGNKFEEAADHAITRPHYWAPDKAPLNKVTNRATAPLDAAADQIRFKGNVPEASEVSARQ